MPEPHPKTLRLYDLVLENGCTISPFVWRIKYAIAHKGFGIESIARSPPAHNSGVALAGNQFDACVAPP
jgi:hypothetical protein